MKRLAFILLLMLLLPTVLSADKVIYKGWVRAGQDFQINNVTFKADYTRETNITVLLVDNKVTVIFDPRRNTTCARGGLYAFCQTNQKFELSGFEVPPDVSSRNINVSLYLTINRTEAALNMSRTLTPSLPFLGDSVEIRTVIERIGGAPITNISFTDTFNNNFAIENLGGCTINNNVVRWEGDYTGRITCTYRVRPLVEMDFKNPVVLTYDVLGTTQRRAFNYTFNVTDQPFKIETRYPNTTMTGQPMRVNLTVRAASDFAMREMRIEFPESFQIMNQSGFAKVGNMLVAKDFSLSRNSRANFSFTVMNGFTGSHKINVTSVYVYNTRAREVLDTITANYTGKTFVLEIFKREENSLLRITNYEDEPFRNIEVRINDMVFSQMLLETMRYKEFEFPLQDKEMAVEVSYRSVYNQRITNSFVLGYNTTETVPAVKPAEQREEQKEKQKFTLDIDSNTFIVIGGILGGAIIVFLIFTVMKKRFSKSKFEKEIERIKKEVEETEEQ
jgi:hypothetical protein